MDGRRHFENASVDVNFLFVFVFRKRIKRFFGENGGFPKRISVDGASEPEECIVKDASSEGVKALTDAG